MLRPHPGLGVAVGQQPVCRRLTEIVEAELARDQHRPRAPPEQLALLVVDIRGDELAEALGHRRRGREALPHEQDARLSDHQARARRIGRQALEVRQVVTADLDEPTLGEPAKGVDDPCTAEVRPRPPLGLPHLDVQWMYLPAVVEGVLGLGHDRADRDPRPLLVPGALDERCVRLGIPEHQSVSSSGTTSTSSSRPRRSRCRRSTAAADQLAGHQPLQVVDAARRRCRRARRSGPRRAGPRASAGLPSTTSTTSTPRSRPERAASRGGSGRAPPAMPR